MRRLRLVNNRDFMLLWTGEAVSQLGSQASTVAFPLLVLSLTGSAAKAGIVGLAKWLPLAVTALPAGQAADRFDRKRLMIASDAIRALLQATIPVALWLGNPPFFQIAAVAFLDGCLFTVSYVAERGALPHVVDIEQLPDAVTQNEARLFAANIVGPPLGGLLYTLGRSLPFVADACSSVISMVTVAATRASFQFRSHAPRPEPWGGVAEGLRWLWRQPFFRSAALLFAAGNPLYTGLYLLAILLAKQHGASSSAVGAMFALVGVGGLVGAIAEFPTPLTNSFVSGYRVAATPDHLQGRVQAAGTLTTMSLAWLGPLVVGFAFQHAGANTTVLMITGWAALLAILTTSIPSLRAGPPRRAQAGSSKAAGVPV